MSLEFRNDESGYALAVYHDGEPIAKLDYNGSVTLTGSHSTLAYGYLKDIYDTADELWKEHLIVEEDEDEGDEEYGYPYYGSADISDEDIEF